MKIKWKTSLKNVSFVILVLKMCFIFGQQKVIVIDPGHGGKDSGAIGINGILEKEVVLNISKEIIRLNKTLLNDTLNIYLTRYKDTLISLKDRCRLAKYFNADLFVSLHCNSSHIYSKGIEIYVHTSDFPCVKESIDLGLSILNESTKKLGLKNRGMKFENFQVLRETTTFCPAILIESAFITNSDEADYFIKPQNINAIALAILIGIINYLNIQL